MRRQGVSCASQVGCRRRPPLVLVGALPGSALIGDLLTSVSTSGSRELPMCD